MRKRIAVGILGLGLALIVGLAVRDYCSTIGSMPRTNRLAIEFKTLESIKPGMAKTEIVEMLGSPFRNGIPPDIPGSWWVDERGDNVIIVAFDLDDKVATIEFLENARLLMPEKLSGTLKRWLHLPW